MATAELLDAKLLSHEETVAALSHPDALWEIVDGRVMEKTESALAISIASLMLELIGAECRCRNPGRWTTEMVFILDSSKNTRLRPDIAFVSSHRWPLNRTLPFRTDWEVVPNIAVEVVCPSNRAGELSKKRRRYFRYGVEEVWIIYPEDGTVEVHEPKGSRVFTHEEKLTSRLLPEIEIDLAGLLPFVEDSSD